ncbi:NAD(P)H-binding protein [Streptomyces sp. LP05-1]|uniref:NAD(P)H-binding protein n=1 Tax=Streptomyces pyxinae TaxID=2970734 RepID=A0ABT2CQL2_9ACTN|nr:NAD(P)H-binding protein [Streptomyces sp. LP05-1]MCS0639731.1 NAD(P)H-binding protein [Streptomyces sp. LP05-1]
MSTILVTGGTGTLGSHVTERLRAEGHEVRVLSRKSRPYAVDLRTGAGLDRALAGVDTVVHCASSPAGGDEEAARNLIAGARRAGVGHLVYISIVGVDRVPYSYYRSKLAVERLVEESGLGWTTLRATQFHELVVSVLGVLAKTPAVMVLPAGLSDQPVEVREVAGRLAELAAGAPAGRVPDMAGPQVLALPELARAYLRATGRSRKLLSLPLAGRTYRAFRSGGHLAPDRAVGTVTFEEYLRKRFGRA